MSKDYTPFANRLRKMAKHYGKWARRQELDAYRVYDADLDEFPIIVDRYAEQVYVSLFHRKGEAWTEDDYQDRKLAYREIITAVLEVGQDQVFFKLRKRQTGNSQYEKLSIVQREFTVVENGLGFIVNLTDYLDTGLYADQRNLRLMIAKQARDKRVLHLFSYTCTLGTYAAAAEAFRVDSLDNSNTYLEWGKRNFALNEIEIDRHRFLREDIMQWLKKPNLLKYDLIVLTPPTFSNSKELRNDFDLQEDHVKLIRYCLPKLNEGGQLFFLTNARKFKLATEALKGAGEIKDITAQTLPQDYRKRNLHRCWRITVPPTTPV